MKSIQYLILSVCFLLSISWASAETDVNLQSKDGTKLHAVFYPSQNARSFLFIVHGLQSHMGWFNYGDQFAANGISSFGYDRRGSGLSDGLRGHADSPDDFYNDFDAALNYVMNNNPQHLPIDVMANSLGGVIALNYISEHAAAFRSLILTTPGTNVTPEADYSFLTKLQILNAPANQYFDTPLHDEQFVEPGPFLDWIHNDQLSDRKFTAAFLRSVNTMKSNVQTAVSKMQIPLFLMLANRDQVIDNAGVVSDVYNNYSASKKLSYYDSMHYLFFGTDRDKVVSDMVAWAQSL